MNELKQFWQAIESLPGIAAVAAEWQAWLEDEFDWAKRLLRPRSALAASYPRLDGCGLPYEVVEHDTDDLVGVCRETGETIPLIKGQLVVYELESETWGIDSPRSSVSTGTDHLMTGASTRSAWAVSLQRRRRAMRSSSLSRMKRSTSM
ncbi:MAG TPA: hypothetical protein VH682_10470 [Gemmataceae bacterium]|jgi:hypothetical protein